MNTEETINYYNENPLALWIAFGVICLGSFFSTMTVSAVNVAIPELARDLNASAVQIGWIPSAFIVTNVVFVLPFGQVADRHGRKKIYLLGLILFSLSSLVSAVVTNIELFLVVRSVQGIAASMIFATGMALIISIIPITKRGMALGIASAFMYLGLSCGPIVGGWLTEYLGWRSIFLFQVPFTLLAVFLVLAKVKGDWKNDLNEPLDWQGSLIFIVWVTAIFVGISELPSPKAFASLCFGLVVLSGFILHQLRKEYPLIRFQPVLDNKIFSTSLLINLLMYGANYPLIFLLSIYLQYVHGYTPSGTGQLLVLPAIAVAIVAPLSGKLSDVYDPRKVATIGCIIFSLGFVLLFGITHQLSFIFTVTGLLLSGIGFGIFSTPNNNSAMSSVRVERLGMASSLMSFSRTAGNMLGTMTVMLLISVNIGGQEIQPENYPALTGIVYWALGLSCLYGFLSAWFSFPRESENIVGEK